MSDRASRLVIRGGASSALGFFIRFFARLLFLFVAGRLFGTALFGAYSIAVAVVEVAVIAGGLGSRWLLFHWLDEQEEGAERSSAHRLIDAVMIVVAASSLIALAVMVVVALLPRDDLAPNTITAIFWLAPMIVVQALIELLLAATRWKQVMRHEVVGKSVIQPYASVVAALIAWQVGAQQHGLVISYVAGSLAAFVYALFAVQRTFGLGSLAGWRPDVVALGKRRSAIAANTGSDLIEALFMRIDIYAVGILLGEGAAGIYAMARQLAVALRQVRQSFDGMLVPLMAKTLSVARTADVEAALASSARLVLVVQIPVLMLFIVDGAPLLNLFGPGFAAGYGALVCLGLAEALQGAFGVGDMPFIYRRPVLGMLITAASTAVGIPAILLLSPFLGLTGVGLAVLGSYLFRALARRRFLTSHFGISLPIAYHAGSGLAAAAAIGAGLAIRDPVTALAAALALYAALILLWLRVTGARLAPEGLVVHSLEAGGDDLL